MTCNMYSPRLTSFFISLHMDISVFMLRVQAGYCFHLFTSMQAASLIEYQLPEILRTPLEELCLQVKV